MPNRTKLTVLLAMILASLLFGAQLHCCMDLNSQSLDSHVCPICSATGSAIVSATLAIAMAPAINRLEEFGVVIAIPLVVPQGIAPRGPPLSL